MDATEGLVGSIKECFQAFFDGDVDAMKTAHDAAVGFLNSAIALAEEVDPKMEVAPGSKSDFKFDLYTEVLQNLKSYVSELGMIICACDGAENDGPQILSFLSQRA